MPLYDYRCSMCGTVTERTATPSETELSCLVCRNPAHRVWLSTPKIDYLGMAQGRTATPDAIERFDRMHRQQKDKEERSLAEHGDYGPRPGAD